MFANTFEKIAKFYLPGQQTLANVGGRAMKAVGSALHGVHSGTGRALRSGGGAMMEHASHIAADKKGKDMVADLVTKNRALKMQGKPELKINQKAIERNAMLSEGKKLEKNLSGSSGLVSAKEKGKPNFIQKHPYISLAGGMYAAHKMSQPPSGPDVERPQLGY